jgi:CRP/FNR family transcriptional regulator, anaerobic regulatory protein
MLTENDHSFLDTYLPFLHNLDDKDNRLLNASTVKASFLHGEAVINKQQECNGLVVVKDGQLRAFFDMEDGKEITLYRLLSGDVCILTASCVLKNITFEVTLEAEKDSELYLIPASILVMLTERYSLVKNFTSDLVAERFSEVMWVVEQMVSKNMGQRIASFLLEQSTLEETSLLVITHETIAKNLGTAREVVSRVLKYLEGERLLLLSRGHIELIDIRRLQGMVR